MNTSKLILSLLLLSQSLLLADWIQPPLQTLEGYPVPQPDRAPELPRDHGAHPEYAIEWWYWVGHLEATDSDESFGFQSTVFRLGGDPNTKQSPEPSILGHEQLYMSHAALSELSTNRYFHSERIFRNGWQATASTEELRFSAGNIQVAPLADRDGQHMILRYSEDAYLELTLIPQKPIVVFGERGLSRKGADPAAVSLYWSYTRIKVSGTLHRNGRPTAVSGSAWMDHEISSSQLGSDLAGWDWTAIQLDDGTEVKAYRLRQVNGGSDPWSAIYWIDRDGATRSVYADQFKWITEKTWLSSNTGTTYPTSVRIEAIDPEDGSKKIYRLRPKFDAQEFIGNNGSNPYWEGACDVLDEEGQRIGKAYLELAGYSGGLRGKLN
jgi:predicted secreted hydrolase